MLWGIASERSGQRVSYRGVLLEPIAQARVIMGPSSAVMNFLFGIIVGIVLTVGTAFIADWFVTASVSADATSRQIVNWDVAKERLLDSSASIRVGWERLERGIDHIKL